jgi:uncharacterized membrane protein YhaH (DUF805 family)
MTNWFISINGDQKGPYPTDQLRQLVSDGFVARDAYVWREGMAQWQPLSQVRVADDAPVAAAPTPQVRETAAAQIYATEASYDAGTGSATGYVKPGYFSFQGRIGRQTLWLSYIVLFFIITVIASLPLTYFAISAHGDPDQLQSPQFLGSSAFLGIVILILAIGQLAGTVKRLHDRNRSGWFIFIQLIPLVGPIWLFIELGFLKGTDGPNTYGVDPLG